MKKIAAKKSRPKQPSLKKIKTGKKNSGINTSNTTNASRKTAVKNAASKSIKPVKTKSLPEAGSTFEIPGPNETTFSRSAAPAKRSKTCKCMQRKTKFYCYRLIQGAWVQVPGAGYPDKDSCENDNCLS